VGLLWGSAHIFWTVPLLNLSFLNSPSAKNAIDDPSGDQKCRRPGLGETEVEDLYPAVGGDLDVGGLEVVVDDSLVVRFLEGLGDH